MITHFPAAPAFLAPPRRLPSGVPRRRAARRGEGGFRSAASFPGGSVV